MAENTYIDVLPIESVLSLLRGEKPEVRYKHPIDEAAIIMMSSFRRPDEIENCDNVLFLDVDDITYPDKDFAFKLSDAKNILQFLEQWQECHKDDENLYIISSCDGGVSRSAGLCAALRIGFGQEDDAIWGSGRYSPNELVYSVMREALGMPVSSGELDFKMKRNTQARKRYFSGY